jgi:drug/metabolite transporter (DMT)-like permease
MDISWLVPSGLVPSWLWIPVTLAAACAQTARNLTQRRLTETLGTLGATQVRFLYGFPFALIFLALVCLGLGQLPPRPDGDFALFVFCGAVSQILATALMLSAMRLQGFAVVTAYTKTEPVQVAIFAAVVLGEHVTLMAGVAIVIATLGVTLMTRLPAGIAGSGRLKPAMLGIAAGAMFALAAVGFRGAILSLSEGNFLLRATTTLAWGLGIQTALLGTWLLVMRRDALFGSFRAWRPSVVAGFLGALASQFWFIGFSLTSAANVRTLALVEVLFAGLLSHKLLSRGMSVREALSLALVVGGVALLLISHR